MYDIRNPEYWDDAALEKEMHRVFDICHGCRMCFSYCPSFPELFDRIDEHEQRGEGETEALTRAEMERVVDLCYQCKLCFVKCPYTPPHEWNVDFPRLVLRAKAVRARKHGVSLQDRFLGDPDALGKLAGWMPAVANAVNRMPAARALMERVVGIHRERNLPEFHRPFRRWHEAHAKDPHAVDEEDQVVLFTTCVVSYHEPDIGAAVVQVLERNGKRAHLVYERCCGMPYLDGGDVEAAQRNAHVNVTELAAFARRGTPILVPQPTCGFVIKQEWPGLLGSEDAQRVAAATMDVSEYLMKLAREGKLDTSFERPQGKIAYHAPCHLRAQNIGHKSKELLEKIPGTQVELVEKCSAFDGTWGMKKEFYEISLKYAGKLNRAIEQVQADQVASDCSLAKLNMVKGGHAPRHPIQIVRDAYGMTSPFERQPREAER